MSSTTFTAFARIFAIFAGSFLLASASVRLPGNEKKEVPHWPSDTLRDSSKVLKEKANSGILLRWKDYYQNRLVQPRPKSAFYLKDPVVMTDNVLLDSLGKVTVQPQIQTQADPLDYRASESMDFETYDKIQTDRAFKSLLKDYSINKTNKLAPKLDVPASISRLMGDNFLNFKPTGFVTLDLGVMHQYTDNPTIPIRQRKNTQFIFNEQISINFDAKLGDLLGFQTNYDTKANFNFENAIKLNYKNPEQSFLKKVEAGNINWAINSQLIPGVQNLFGMKTDFQFGRLSATFVASQQRSSKERIVLKGGAQSREFEISAGSYDENRHFFLSYYFRNIYEKSLKATPVINSGVTITRVEVYVTNRTTTTETLRNIVGFSDLAEPVPNQTTNSYLLPVQSRLPVGNATNGLYNALKSNENFRQVDNTNSTITGMGFEKTVDYELLRGAKKLTADRDYTFHSQLGYLSLTTALRNDEVLAVSYEYTYNGKSYQVGELTEDYQNRKDDEVIVLKLLKSSTLRNHLTLPMWELMMKNIYSLGTTQVEIDNFHLRVIYKDDATGMDNPNLQESSIANLLLIRLMGLDRLNSSNETNPDGNFDFLENVTINSQTGKVIFPVLEPFGSTLSAKFGTSEDSYKAKYVFSELYDKTMTDAQQVSEHNKFYLKGTYQSSGGATVTLPYNVSESSVTVTSGGVSLSAGSDYVVETQLGQVRILNTGVLNSGREIIIEYERADLFQNQIRTLIGTRLDYVLNRDVSFGFTAMSYKEKPAGFLTRVSIGNEPVSNSMIGFDFNIRKNAPFLTRFLDKLPFIQTKEMSTVQFKAEVAKLFPGVAKNVNNRALVDDFESAETVYNLGALPQKWRLASVPPKFQTTANGGVLGYSDKRAKISAYIIDNIFAGSASLGAGYTSPANITDDDRKNFYERQFLPTELFPNRSVSGLVSYPLSILDVAYYPSERGMYNYNTDLAADGRLKTPKTNFGALTRAITSENDFDNANIKTLEFWLLDPFIKDETNGIIRDGYENKRNTTGGKLVFNLGDISEDVLPDERYNFENGLPLTTKVVGDNVDSTAWGYATKSQYVINAFTNETGARAKQDVGLDGLSDAEENSFYKTFLNSLPAALTADARAKILADPSSDNFKFFLGDDLDAANLKVLERYKNYLGMENNSPESATNGSVTPASTNVPDGEDLNSDNTINDTEAYFEYEIDLKPDQLTVGSGFVVDKTTTDGQTWYLFRVPIDQYTSKVGSIDGFKSIRFIRMYLSEFEQPVVLRFAELQMVGQQYRAYTNDLSASALTEIPEPYDANLTIGTVSIEENNGTSSSGRKYQYSLPPGWVRDQDNTQSPAVLLNEQSMSLCVTNLRDGDARAVYKNVNLNLLFRKRLRMYLHMQNDLDEDNAVGAFLRIGTDLTQNYYEVEIAKLIATRPAATASTDIWPEINEINIALADLVNLKSTRNQQADKNLSIPYTITTADGYYNISVVGNPDLSAIKVMMIGMKNPKSVDEAPKSFCIWTDEMHVEGFDDTGGLAAVAQLNVKLADFATISASGRIETFGFGSVQSRISERSQNLTMEYGLSSNVAVDKLLPQKWGFSIPMYLSYDRKNVKPHFDPLNPDTPLSTTLANLQNAEERDGYRRMVEENVVKRGINFSNVRKMKTNPGTANHFYDFENFTFTYAFNDDKRRNILTQEYTQKFYKGGVGYTFISQPKSIEPFKKWTSTNRWAEWIKEFNFSLLPNAVSVRADVDRKYLKTQLRNSDLTTDGISPTFEKSFWFNRYYDFGWNLTRRMTLSYSSIANAIIDEPEGDLNTQQKKDSLWSNFKKLGRIKNFDQNLVLTYRLPLEKIPLLDWMTADYKHAVSYNYQANTLGLKDTSGVLYGDIIGNSRDRGLSGRIDLVALYNKLRYLKFANTPVVSRKNFARSPGDVEDIDTRNTDFVKTMTRLLMSVRGITYAYTIRETTSLPGYLRSPRYFGLDNTNAPGIGFVLGQQDHDFQVKAGRNGWLTESLEQNQYFQQTVARNFNAGITLEPFKDFKMVIDARYTRQDAYQEIYKMDTVSRGFTHQSAVRTGSFSMSFISLRTAFTRMKKDNSSPVFDKFIAYRSVVQERLNRENNEGGAYNSNSQDVLIAAFSAAYREKDPQKVKVNPFLSLPMPNWEINYGGLSQLPGFRKMFSSFTLRHKYVSTYSVGNFTSSLDYESLYVNLAVNGYPLSSMVNDLGQYIPVFVMSTITLSEKLQPLIGFEFKTTSKVTARLEYNRDRTIALNLSNSQVAELFNQDVTFNLGFTKNNAPLPFKIKGVKKRLKNDMTFQLGVTYKDTRSIQRKFDGENVPVAGNIYFQLHPALSYMVNNRLNFTFYIDRTFNDPLISTSYYRSSTSGGVQLKFNLGG